MFGVFVKAAVSPLLFLTCILKCASSERGGVITVVVTAGDGVAGGVGRCQQHSTNVKITHER